MDQQTITAIHAAAGELAIACTGGGSSAIAQLLAVAGASRTVLEATVPYHAGALAHYIGGTPDQACSGQTARALAMAAYQRAQRFDPAYQPLFGVGCTAAIATDRTRRGADRCHVAIQSRDETIEYNLNLSSANRDRTDQERICSELILAAVARAFGLTESMPTLLDDESLSNRQATAKPEWRELFSGQPYCTASGSNQPALVFPGAFNPLHAGHRRMADIASQASGKPVLLEISAINVDKPPLDYIEMQAREAGLGGEYAVTFSNAATFVEKSALFPGATLIVGTDTLERIVEPRYYFDSQELCDQAIATIASRGVTFMVFGRLENGHFEGLDDLNIPDRLRHICTGIPESRFRADVSSRSIRQKH